MSCWTHGLWDASHPSVQCIHCVYTACLLLIYELSQLSHCNACACFYLGMTHNDLSAERLAGNCGMPKRKLEEFKYRGESCWLSKERGKCQDCWDLWTKCTVHSFNTILSFSPLPTPPGLEAWFLGIIGAQHYHINKHLKVVLMVTWSKVFKPHS